MTDRDTGIKQATHKLRSFQSQLKSNEIEIFIETWYWQNIPTASLLRTGFGTTSLSKREEPEMLHVSRQNVRILVIRLYFNIDYLMLYRVFVIILLHDREQFYSRRK